MRVRFNVEYSTVYGENLVLNIVNSANGEKVASHVMKPATDTSWKCDLDVPAKAGHIDYFYSVERDGKEMRHEWTVIPHRLDLNATKANRYITFDHWNDMPDDSYLYSSAFTDCVALRKHQAPPKCKHLTIVQLKVRAPQLSVGESLGVVGNEPTLGDWDASKALKMTEHNHN
ncbi:MAG: 4-alpha-glucanotransferase, partial [Muribaculaceae bacterium]|nr:4-alpha-glucanotransferase [Muribaculaceae bacterium]